MNKKQLYGYTLECKLRKATNNKLYFASKGGYKYILKFSIDPSFNQEFLMMKEINHENILPVIEYFSIGQLQCYSMPFGHGGDLHLYISSLLSRRLYITEDRARFIMKQIFSGLLYVHQCNIIHRDIKPENFLFMDKHKLNIRLIDFGLAIKNTTDKDFNGTKAYMAPEIYLKIPCFIIFKKSIFNSTFSGENDHQQKVKLKKLIFYFFILTNI